jgi:hypothetical protein
MRSGKRTLGEAIQYLSYILEVIDHLRKKGTKDKVALSDIDKGLKALEVSVDYFKLAQVNVTKEDIEKRNAESKE